MPDSAQALTVRFVFGGLLIKLDTFLGTGVKDFYCSRLMGDPSIDAEV